jgi:hypothetical protein
MKTYIFLIYLLISWTNYCSSQTIDTIYYNKNDQIASPKNFNYYRIARQDSGIVKVFDYDKSGKMKMSGGFKSFDLNDPTGPFYYYKKNRIEKLDLFEPSKYQEILANYTGQLKNIPRQPDTLNLRIFFYNNKKVKWIGYITKKGIYSGPGVFFTDKGELSSMFTSFKGILNGECTYYKNNKIIITGSFKDGKPNGKWLYYSKDGKIRKTNIYHD